jgi:hypothetical protein
VRRFKWVKIPYFQLELLIPQQLLRRLAQLSPPDFDGTNRKHTSSFYIKKLFKKITRLNVGFELKETSFKFYYLLLR